jgi:hypothetical protein
MKSPMTAGQWARSTKRERSIAFYFLVGIGGLGLLGTIAAMSVFVLGELTGFVATDVVVLLFVNAGSLFALRKGFFLIEAPVCRFCLGRLGDDQFRCPNCTKTISEQP